ncbi:hypothetical protein LOK74_23550 [Brevibacillus humidisoli]|uniref:hypothetical protein n=1 Tax=Brevibacillus humidisoli TaxID=2895522 RepID=UPI001E39ACCC|nr:hypothetical protein [Brevibacillus humidisoli]UFJ40924.1 hypothetical protein LOK74_23550 [Brevibacillus humidisoli]
MDIEKWAKIAKSIPREKLKSDEGLREVIRELAKKAGKNVNDRQLDQYVAKFRTMSRTETASSLMNKLSQKGVRKQELDKIKKRFHK